MAAQLIEHVKQSFANAEKYASKIDAYILQMDGMTGKKTRHFYNNLCAMPNARYLEIGVWKGSSLCAAMCGNTATCLAIENWSEFGGPKGEFMDNYEKYKGSNDAHFLEGDCFSIDVGNYGPFNIYMYDGNHDEESHYKALHNYLHKLEDVFIYIIDDWNWEKVRKGTLAAIDANYLNIAYKNEIFTNNKVHPPWGVPGGAGKDGDWHNGICVFVLCKKTV